MKVENTNYVNYLIELSQNGRKSAFIDLCEINLTNVFTIIYRLTAEYDLSKKLTVVTFLEAWEKIKNYDFKISFVLWIKNIAISHALENLNRLSISTQDINPTEDRLKNLENIIMNLDYERRIIFVLHDLEGYTYEEIANFLHSDFIDEIKTKLIEIRNYLINKICK
ncbi:MAG: sigma factor-like helix-turn-helix DNA-binding protein [Melioribacter sp.]|uniref:RNA polymerase sigma factor n=1 Tax=Rosettibacter primus TaxID=3111523 RepID=UPI00247B372A|nr:sigma factor-like helix-turn-helix DNA-binding protein [Melioribacter sp.]